MIQCQLKLKLSPRQERQLGHWLYKIADSEVESFTPWAKLEALATLNGKDT